MKNFSCLNLPSFFVLFASLFFCGCLAVCFGKEMQWDLVSYHYYNAFAFLHHRWGYDSWPVGYIQLFINPLMDMLGYFLISHFTPLTAVFMLGVIHGLNVWLMYCIAYIVIQDVRQSTRIVMAIVLAAIGMWGTAASSEIGSFMGDDLISVFGLGAIVLLTIVLQ